jgi:hypothetical protein
VALQLVVVATVALNVTVPDDPKFVPVMVTCVPTAPEVGDKVVITGACFTVSVKFWVAAPTLLLAVIVREYVPAVPDPGVPLNVPVPFPLSLNVTPLGSVPVSLSDGVGAPVAVTVKLPATPTENVVPLALVIVGAAWAPANSP